MMKGSDDLSELTQTIRNIIEEGVKKTESMPSPCIFRVPEKLHKVKESAYTPQLVSIGPLHSNKEHLKSPMEDIKKHYAEALFKRVPTANETEDFTLVLKECVEKMSKPSLDTARDCYAEKVEVDVEKMKESLDKAKECFAKKVDVLEDVEKMKELLDRAKECFPKKVDALDVPMLVIDGCFILELLYRWYHEADRPDMIGTSNNPNSNKKTSPDLCFDTFVNRVAIRHDLLLLESQLPFFVLQDLFDLTVARIPIHLPSLSDYLLSYFGNMMNPSEQSHKNDQEQSHKNDREPKICHVLHFLYNQYRQQQNHKNDPNRRVVISSTFYAIKTVRNKKYRHPQKTRRNNKIHQKPIPCLLHQNSSMQESSLKSVKTIHSRSNLRIHQSFSGAAVELLSKSQFCELVPLQKDS